MGQLMSHIYGGKNIKTFVSPFLRSSNFTVSLSLDKVGGKGKIPGKQPDLLVLFNSDRGQPRARARMSLHDKCKLMNMRGEG